LVKPKQKTLDFLGLGFCVLILFN